MIRTMFVVLMYTMMHQEKLDTIPVEREVNKTMMP